MFYNQRNAYIFKFAEANDMDERSSIISASKSFQDNYINNLGLIYDTLSENNLSIVKSGDVNMLLFNGNPTRFKLVITKEDNVNGEPVLRGSIAAIELTEILEISRDVENSPGAIYDRELEEE